jgi:hypothetical protein
MYQQWLQIIGLIFDGVGFGLIALEWYRGYREMRKKVDLVTRNMERAEKIRLRDRIKQAIGMAGVGEVEALYKDDKTLAEMAEHAFEIDQVDASLKHTPACSLPALSLSWPAWCCSWPAAGRDAAHSLASSRSHLDKHVVANDGTKALGTHFGHGRIPWLS